MSHLTPVEFVEMMYDDARLYCDPEPMTVTDAAYNIREYKADGIPVPPGVTPRTYTRIWNICYMRDKARKAVVEA